MVPFPYRSNFLTKVSIKLSDNRYPKEINAVFNSCLSIFPELSLSKVRKQFCQSVTYFHRAPKSSNVTWPLPLLSNIPTKSFLTLIFSNLKKSEFTNHQTNSFGIERAPRPVRKGRLQFGDIYRATSVTINPTKTTTDASPPPTTTVTIQTTQTHFLKTSHRNSRLGIGELKCDIPEVARNTPFIPIRRSRVPETPPFNLNFPEQQQKTDCESEMRG